MKTAAMIPIAPASREKTLTTPPRTPEEEAMITPIIPEMMAIMASTKPRTAPVAKLRTAAIIAIIENMLKVGSLAA